MGMFAKCSIEKGYEGQSIVKSFNLLIPKSLKKNPQLQYFLVVIEVAVHRYSNTQV